MCFKFWGKNKNNTENKKDSDLKKDADLLEQNMAWLADAPLFIDSEQVASFYDAVVRPEYETKAITLSLKQMKATKISGKAGAEVEGAPEERPSA